MASRKSIQQRFGEAVQQRRSEIGMSQEQLAHASGLSRSYIGDVERGARNLALVNIEKICKAMGICLSDFFQQYGVDS